MFVFNIFIYFYFKCYLRLLRVETSNESVHVVTFLKFHKKNPEILTPKFVLWLRSWLTIYKKLRILDPETQLHVCHAKRIYKNQCRLKLTYERTRQSPGDSRLYRGPQVKIIPAFTGSSRTARF